MEFAIYSHITRVIDAETRRAVNACPSHTFEEPGPAPEPHPQSRFRPERSEAMVHRVKAPIGSKLVPGKSRGATWLMLEIYDGTTHHAASVLDFARKGERGFALLSEEFTQPAPTRDPIPV